MYFGCSVKLKQNLEEKLVQVKYIFGSVYNLLVKVECIFLCMSFRDIFGHL